MSEQPRTLSVRIVATASLLCAVGTIVAAQIDFLRRHQPGMAPERYWVPQLVQIWLPGLGAALLLGVAAFVLERRARGQ
jgi:hypothetical protein